MTAGDLALVLAALAAPACEREQRTFTEPGPSARPLSARPFDSLFPGEQPLPGAALDPALPGYVETAQAVNEGQQLYAAFNCIGCHQHGGGGIGPALIDDHWIYGSSPLDIAMSIIAGRPMGMPSYRGKLASTQVYQLVVYVRSLGGLVRGDAVSARDEHLRTGPPPTLEHAAIPMPGRERAERQPGGQPEGQPEGQR
jgi:cytochrome c oxidase cbb3-type subunit 3